MKSKSHKSSRSGKIKITVALISLVGLIAVAVITKYDGRSTPTNTMQVTYSGYRPTSKFDTEFRYFIDVSGTRAAVESMQSTVVDQIRNIAISQHPNRVEEINSIFETALKEAPTLDEIVQKYLPVYRKHFTVREIQELNKFYSTEIMQNMVTKLPVIQHEVQPLMAELLQEYQTALMSRL